MTDVILAGVGGQGAVLSAQVLAETALSLGFDVKTSEVHGMAQRGGSVISMVRWSEKVHSPLIPRGKADFLLAFELLEGLRNLEYLSLEGTAIVNDYSMDPLTVLRGDVVYPVSALEDIRSNAARVVDIDARGLASEAGNPRAAGSCLLGALSSFLEFPVDGWEESIRRFVPSKAREVNLRAFALGRKACSGYEA
ncbi:MAG: indolepyruvate oxidoreductase subunit beta [Actinomycetota bacterium]|nr:indolepyruvate oxidoreductase subunit beta [Actinomycetota bacterium]